MSNRSQMTVRERIALAVSGCIVAFMIVYWASQILGVIHMLRLAYG